MRTLRTLIATAILCLTVGGTASAADARSARHREKADPYKAVPVVTGLSKPVTFAAPPGGRIFFGDKATGQINVFDPHNGDIHRFTTISHVVSAGEQGLLGLALDPKYPNVPFVFAYATRNVGGGERDQILRMKNVNGHAEDVHVIFSSKTVSG